MVTPRAEVHDRGKLKREAAKRTGNRTGEPGVATGANDSFFAILEAQDLIAALNRELGARYPGLPIHGIDAANFR
jgi:hypothetical protein